jgi:hypothetical protein
MAQIKPTLDDNGVMDFAASGLVILEGVIDPDFNRRADSLDRGNCDAFIASDDFTRQVLLHPQVAGVVRSLLGEDFLVPRGGHHHYFQEPHLGQTWHSDGLSGNGYDVTELQCYYYPHSVAIEDGPTMVLPGSHCRAVDREAIAHYGDIRGQTSLTVPAGTVALTRYGIWHKAGPKTNDRARSMIKFSYHRTAPPQRDWLCDTAEIPAYRDRARLDYVTEVESYRDKVRRTRTWNWLCGSDREVALRWEKSQPVSELLNT